MGNGGTHAAKTHTKHIKQDSPRRSVPAVGTPKRPGRGRRTALIIALSVCCVFALAAAVYMIWETPPATTDTGLQTHETPASSSPADSGAAPSPSPSGTGRKDGCYTVLVVGKDKVGANTDTILIGRLDTVSHKLDVVSIPRDTMANVPFSVKKINTLYGADLNNGGNGVDGLMDGMTDFLGFRPDNYAVIDLKAFIQLVDTIGGVTYNVPCDMDYDAPDQDLHIHYTAGEQHLTGQQAMEVFRWRQNNPGSPAGNPSQGDIGRIGRQQDFLKSVAKQTLTAGNIANLSTFIDIFEENVDTDLTAANLAFYAREFLLCKSENVNFHTMPGNYADGVGGFSYVTVSLPEWLQMVNDCLNPYSEPVTEKNVNILTRDERGELYGTNGSIAGGEDSFLTMEEYMASIGLPYGNKGSSTASTPAPETSPAPGDGDGETSPDVTPAPAPTEPVPDGGEAASAP